MAVYTDISAEELSAFLEGYDLGAPVSFKGIAEGVENSNFLLETTRGRYILTLYERRVRREDLPFFVDLMSHLAAQGFPCPRPVADRAGAALGELKGKAAAIVTFLPGLCAQRPTASQCREAGAGLAWLHDAAQGFTQTRPNTLGSSSWAGLFAPQATAAEALDAGLAQRIASDLAHLAARWPADLPSGVVHADFFPDNVFFAEGRFAGAIDFYFAATDALAYDVAVALNAWAFDAQDRFSEPRARALLAGYQARRPLSPTERAALPVLAHGAALRFFLTRLIDWNATPPGSLVRPKDPMEYERKLAAHRAGLPLTSLAAS